MIQNLGHAIREVRRTKGLTQRQVAEAAGCTPAYLSLVENGKADPSLTMLKKLAAAVDTRVVDMLRDQPRKQVVLRKAERVRVEFPASKMSLEQLVPQIASRKIAVHIVTVKPGGESGGGYTHEGEEAGLVLQGHLTIIYDGMTYELEEGDSFYLLSSVEHHIKNTGDKDTVLISCAHPPSF